ncbi:zinc finger protein 407 isoform X3 [Varanus komodoensis]|uniref:zinc finger protein 407 isoform X3 n=1 Tax=Varanus komodoensis TaxID=61221 RepID=UPI001CF7EAAC|nr:zinc finger protein 407 isoform X3 [Varanus komodoensis]
MDVEKNQKNYEGDESVENKLVQEAAKNVLAEKAHSESFSTSEISTFSTEEQKNPGKKVEENGASKRQLSRSVHEDLTETNVLENEPVPKKLKLMASKHAGDTEAKPVTPTKCEDVEGIGKTTGETMEGVAINACPSSAAFISDALCVQHDCTPERDNTVKELHAKSEHSQGDPVRLPECTPSFLGDETSVTSSNEHVSKCKPCDETFSTDPDLEKHIEESHLKESKEHVNPHCTNKIEHSPSLHMHVKQTSGHLRYFCDLCGFQSFEEDHLRAHFLGKTHLRRQNLAARGGFVKILTKKPFHKRQQFSVKEKNVRTKSALNKPKTKSAILNQLRLSSNTLKNLKENCQLFVERIPSKNISTEVAENITSEEASLCNVGGNGEAQPKKLDVLGSSECNPEVLEPAKSSQETVSTVYTTETFDKFHLKRNLLSRRIAFKQSGSFRLNQQIKRRYNLLGIGKRSKSDSSLKHNIRAGFSQGDLSQVKALQTEGDVNTLCKAASEMQALNPDGMNECSSVTPGPEHSPKKAVDVQKTLHPYTHCGCTLPNTEGLQLGVDTVRAEEHKFDCQICGYSCVTREDLELHCQKNSHRIGDGRINCTQCSFVALNDISLGKHVSDKHSMSHYCVTCHQYFLTEEEMAAHNTTEQHINLLPQEHTVWPLNSDLSLQTASVPEVESSVLPKVIELKLQQEIPKPSVTHPGNEFKESVLSRAGFQCKKCFYKTRSSSVLTRHIKLRHAQEYHFLCKACNLYSLSKEGMEKHIKRSKHLENARKHNIGLRFEECIERVCVGANDGKKVAEPSVYGSLKNVAGNESIHVPFSTLENVSVNKEMFPLSEGIKGSESGLGSIQKRGRPKGTISRTCPHCGLLASSVTNLTVHIRRKHSHQYSYLCKICNYYTVTKGDMERHCATKKHKGRLEVNGGEKLEIIVCPEGGNIEASIKKINSLRGTLNEPFEHGNQSPPLDNSISGSQGDDHSSTVQVQVGNAVHLSDRDRNSSEVKEYINAEPGNISQDRDSLIQARFASASDNKCAHCNFVAHSFSSLEVHIKRKHTKEFEYYCMACDYYAVTRREMMRHATTEKHKIKRQSYIGASSGEEMDESNIAKETAVVSQEEQHPSEEFQIILGDTEYKNIEGKSLEEQATQKAKDIPNYLASEDSTTSKICKEGSVFDAETEDGAENGRENAGKHTVHEDEGVKINEMITFKEKDDCVLQENTGDKETVQGHFHFTAETGNKNRAFDKNPLNSNVIDNKNTFEEDIGKGHESTEVSAEEVKTDKTHLPILSETCSILKQQTMDENTERTIQNMHNLEEQERIQQKSAVMEEDTLIHAQQEAEASLNNIWGSASLIVEGVQESNEGLEAFTSAGSRVKEGQFDSSIVKLKSQEDCFEPVVIAEGQSPSGPKVSDRAMKTDVPQGGGKKKKAEGHSAGESPRIRCDDCGFLADGLSGLNVHIAMKHPSKEKHFHCLLCGKSFYTESNLHQHLASAGHMRNEQASVEELPEGGATFKCVKCTEPFDSEQNLFLHIKEQHEELLREVNKYIVEDTEQINREREENKGNICKYCGKMCRSSNSMAFLAHIRTHTGSKPFKCKICHFATAQLGDARNHVKRHLGMREYKCHVCGVAFVMKKHLNTHLLGKHGVGTPKESTLDFPLSCCFSAMFLTGVLLSQRNSSRSSKECIDTTAEYILPNLAA